MIKLEDVTYQYSAAQERNNGIFDISLEIKEGAFILLTGESGCGKSTLIRVLNGLCPKYHSGHFSGRYLLDGNDTSTMSLADMGSVTGSVFQDPRSQFFCTNTTEEVVLSMESRCFSRDEMQKRLMEMSDFFSIKRLLDRRIFSLSSGEKQMIAIAAVCAVRPKVLLFDEPSANLDANTTEQLALLLKRLKAAGHTIIVSEHRLDYLKNIFDRMLLLQDGRITGDYTASQAAALTNQDMDRLGLRYFHIQNLADINTAAPCPDNDDLVQAQNLSIQKGNRSVIKELSISVDQGEVLAITGSNGAGKTTLCKALTGVDKETGGLICFDGVPTKKSKRIRRSFFVQQDTDYQLYAPTVQEEITLGLSHGEYDKERVQKLLEELKLLDYASRHPASLSGGQKQRVLLAAAAIRRNALIVLDEPTSGLDGRHMRKTADLLRTMAGEGHAVVLITHDMELIHGVATRLVHIKGGRVDYNFSVAEKLVQ